MEDSEIITLYWNRDERAIAETSTKYGSFCQRIAQNILTVREDAEECVSDTYQQAWTSIPPLRPQRLRPWLGRVVRNLAINRWRRNHAQKRYAGLEALFSELEECIPSGETAEGRLEEGELTQVLNGWLASLSQSDRVLFLRRYWNGEPLKELEQPTASPTAPWPSGCTACGANSRSQLQVSAVRQAFFKVRDAVSFARPSGDT